LNFEIRVATNEEVFIAILFLAFLSFVYENLKQKHLSTKARTSTMDSIRINILTKRREDNKL